MEVKEAIDEVYQVFYMKYGKFGNQKADDIIALLQQGETDKEELKKYRQEDLKTIQFYIKYYNMWKELKEGTFDFGSDDRTQIFYGEYDGIFEEIMNKLEQKHFPKPVKKTITKEVIK